MSVKIPNGFELKISNIPNAGLGIFAIKPIKANTCLGEYRGKFIPIDEYEKYPKDQKIDGLPYGWAIHDYRGNKDRKKNQKLKDGSVIGYVDAVDPSNSNYLRYVNHPPNNDEYYENVTPYQIKDKMYYMTNRDINVGEELYVNYGPDYFTN